VRLAVAAPAVTTVMLLASCATSPGTAPSPSVADRQACTESSTRQVVDSFIDAFNKGDIARLDRLLPDFLFYATDAPGEFSSSEPRSRSDLIAYITQRHQVHERLNLESFTSSSRSGDFEFEVLRSADDGLTPTPYGGKGQVFCRTNPHTLYLWAMAREPYLRARLPLYGLVATLALAIIAGGVAIGVRRKRGRLSESRPRAAAR
jgi:hypothetical protein